ncbi:MULTISPECIES: alpha/beta fold hydrolase [unclassified Streptomyces]|uniref:alpha/beta fold hydrolase n=1 Tax=unclassified Streptomyces TaxID=2593676 RepID=UPI001318634E|nr:MULTISPECIES: alpha/beta hydrolase [unclassified Streptomyces]QHC32071.1 alpha/beta hydrolase [Streptomyces sp. HF10]WKE68939.1 alpha/beta hydrolase [Streptomyces sp. WP-1]
MTSPAATPLRAPVAVHLGGAGAPRTACVLAPVMARWDRGAFFEPVAEALVTTGHRVTVYDTLSLLRDGDDLGLLADRWAGVLRAEEPDVLVGNALGGAVVQQLLDQPWTHRADVVLLSSPTVADGTLDATLERIAAAVAERGTAAALDLLHEVVRGPADPAPLPAPAGPRDTPDSGRDGADDPLSGRRLATGLRLLHRADLRDRVEAFPGRLLHVYGTESNLVGERHLATGPGHNGVGIPGAGMRPHADQPEATRRAVAAFLAPQQQKRIHDQ